MSVREGDPHGWRDRLRRAQTADSIQASKDRRAALVAVEVYVKQLTERGALLELRSHTLRTDVPDGWFSRAAIRCPDVNLVEGQVLTVQITTGALEARYWPVPSDRGQG